MSKTICSAGVTPRQKAMYFAMFQKAVSALGLRGGDRDAYRVQVMVEETGKEHLHDLNRTSDFEAVIRRFAADAYSFEVAGRFAAADANRIMYNIKVCCLQIMQLKRADQREAGHYLAGVLKNQRIPCSKSDWYLEVPCRDLLKTFQILDVYRRRLISQAGSHNTSFRAKVAYRYDGQILIRHDVPADYYSLLPFNVQGAGGAS